MNNNQTNHKTANNDVAGFDIHLLITDSNDRCSYLTPRNINGANVREALINALIDAELGDYDTINKELGDAETIDDFLHGEIGQREDGVADYEICHIIPLKKIDIQVEYDDEMLDKTIYLPIDKTKNINNAYFA